jgi:DNA-binding beta-propeller fold protein YncE
VAAALALGGCSSTASPQTSKSPLPSGTGWKVETVIPVSSSVGAPVLAGGRVWVPNMAVGTISAIDSSLGRVVRTIPIGNPKSLVAQGCGTSSVHATPHGSFDIRRCDTPSAAAYGDGSLWVTQNDHRAVLRLDPVSGRRLAVIPIGIEPFGLAVGATGVWVTDFQHNTLVQIDPRSNAVAATIPDLPGGPSGLVVGPGSVWVACARAGVVARVDPITYRVVAQVGVAKSPLPVAIAFGSVWVRSEEAHTLARIDPVTDQVEATIDVAPSQGRDGLDQMGVDQTGLWLSGLRITHIEAATNRQDRALAVDGVALDYSAGSLWVSGILGTLSRVRVS